MINCPHCHSAALIKAGHNPSGSQRYQCKACQRVHTPEPNPKGGGAELREQALRLYLEGMGLRRIGRVLKVHHQSISNWINATEPQLNPTPPQPSAAVVIELDELFTFVGEKKTASR